MCNNKWVESHQKINKNLPNVLNSEIVGSTFIKHQKEEMTKQAAFSKIRSCYIVGKKTNIVLGLKTKGVH